MLGNLRIRRVAGALLAGAAFLAVVTSDRTRALQPEGPLLHTGTTVVGETVVYPPGAAQVTAAVVTLAPGQETGWHTHGMPVVGYVIDGELEVDYGEKGIRVYRAGDALMEAIGIAHNGRNIGSGPASVRRGSRPVSRRAVSRAFPDHRALGSLRKVSRKKTAGTAGAPVRPLGQAIQILTML